MDSDLRDLDPRGGTRFAKPIFPLGPEIAIPGLELVPRGWVVGATATFETFFQICALPFFQIAVLLLWGPTDRDIYLYRNFERILT